MQFGILGPLDVCSDGEGVAIGGAKARVVLATLLLSANEPVSGERLAAALWGEEVPASGIKTVQVYVSRLRKALGEGRVETTPAGYVMRLGPGELDLQRFEELVAGGRAELARREPRQAAQRLREALALWRGEPLSDLAGEPFAAAEIRRLDELRIEAVELALDADLAAGRHREVAAEIEALAIEHPLREHVHVIRMLALYRCGRQAESLAAYREARERLVGEIGVEPGAELRRLHEAVLAQDPALELAQAEPPADRDGQLRRLREPWERARQPVGPVVPGKADRAPPAPVPSPRTPLVGREREVDEIGRLITHADVRLVTLIGPGGVGKTRLALEVARRSQLPSAWVELAGVERAADVPTAIVHALQIEGAAGEPAETALIRGLAARVLVLVVDNLEHVLAAAPLLGRMVEEAEGVTILATSREPLELTGEHRYPVAPLESRDAVALFCQAATRRMPEFRATPVVDEICRRLDGLPLAIELAAARLDLFSPAELAERLDGALELLSRGPRDAPARQRTLRATIEWSHRLLDARERAVFAAFAAFADDADLDAAMAVTGASTDALHALLSKQLLRRVGTERIGMLETVRAFALERLTGESRRRHLTYYLALAERAETQLFTRAEVAWLRRLDRERNNLRAALAWGVAEEPALGLQLACALAKYWAIRGPEDEGQRWLETAIAAADESATLVDLSNAYIQLAFTLTNQLKPATASAQRGLELAEAAGDEALRSRAYHAMADDQVVRAAPAAALPYAQQALIAAEAAQRPVLVANAHRLLATALPHTEMGAHLERAVAGFRAIGNASHEAMMYSDLAYVAVTEERYDDALTLLAKTVPLLDDDHPRVSLNVFGNLGLARLLAGDVAGSAEAFEAQLRLAAARNMTSVAAEALGGIAAIAGDRGHDARCARWFGCALMLGPVADGPIGAQLEVRFYAPARERLGQEQWEAELRRGAQLRFLEAVTEVAGV